jgi:hypothetical protein
MLFTVATFAAMVDHQLFGTLDSDEYVDFGEEKAVGTRV